MGANFSNFETRNQPDTSRILVFHSKDRWDAHFPASRQTDKLLVIDFTATWCGPCRVMGVVLKEFAAKYTDVEFIKIDVDELESVAREFAVEALPTFILVKKGKVIDKVVGATKEELRRKIEMHRA